MRHDEEPRKPDSESDSKKPEKVKSTAEQIVRDFEKNKKDLSQSEDDRVEELAPEGEEEPEVQEDHEDDQEIEN